MKNALAKLYPELTPEERFKAMLAAFAREDEGEQVQLKNTCPMKNYKITDRRSSHRPPLSIFNWLCIWKKSTKLLWL